MAICSAVGPSTVGLDSVQGECISAVRRPPIRHVHGKHSAVGCSLTYIFPYYMYLYIWHPQPTVSPRLSFSLLPVAFGTMYFMLCVVQAKKGTWTMDAGLLGVSGVREGDGLSEVGVGEGGWLGIDTIRIGRAGRTA